MIRVNGIELSVLHTLSHTTALHLPTDHYHGTHMTHATIISVASAIDVKKRSNKYFKNVKNVTKRKKRL